MSLPDIPCDWKLAEVDRAKVTELAAALEVPRIVAQLLCIRGIDSVDAGHTFLHPTLDQLTDPFELTGMKEAVARITQARDSREHVRVFGDYDVDGISGTVLLTRALREFGVEHCSSKLPSRLEDGYGLNGELVERAKGEGVDLIVTVDNGIKASEAGERAKACGVDLIITDHHNVEGETPSAVAVINPKQDDPSSPFADASGSAVAFKLSQALLGSPRYLDMVALGTVADIVPLRGENRVLTALGLRAISEAPSPGLSALAKVARISTKGLRAENIAFQLAPRINASGRLGDGMAGLDLLMTDSTDEATRLAAELDQTNEERRKIEKRIYEQALDELMTEFHPSQRTIVLAQKGWHQGVIGIVASKLQHAYCRPVVLIAVDDSGVGKSSARSSPDFDISMGMSHCADLLERYGGHKAAAGMTIREENIGLFRDRLEAYALHEMSDAERRKKLLIDMQIGLSEIDAKLLKNLELLEPFGQGNPPPLVCTFGAEVVDHSVRILNGGHLKLAVRQGPAILDVIGFGMGHKLSPGNPPNKVDIAYTPKFNTWRGETTIQLELKDVKPCS